MSRNGRSLTWDHPEGRPATVVGKFPSDDADPRVSFANGTYFGECSFYADLAPTVDIRTPLCWVVRHDEAQQSFVLIMEDLAGSVQGDQFGGCTDDGSRSPCPRRTALHGPRWGDSTLAIAARLQPAH